LPQDFDDFLFDPKKKPARAEGEFYRDPLFDQFCTFAKKHIESGDIDPTYPLLKEVYKARGYPAENALWYTFLYVTWYNLGSAETVFAKYPSPPKSIDEPLVLPTGTERRSFRGNDKAREHLAVLLEEAGKHGGFEPWMSYLTKEGGEIGWDFVRSEFQKLRFVGPWASYKLADLLAHVHDYAITASDLGIGGAGETAGPIPGLVRLTGYDWPRCAYDKKLQREILKEARDRGVPFSGLDQLETVCCDFNSLCKGAYYVGHDVDAQQEHLGREPHRDFAAARRAVFDPIYLGEIGGWFGVRKHKKTEFYYGGIL
jgi:hypothetical protein